MEQIKMKFYLKDKLNPLAELIFESKQSCKEFVDEMQVNNFVVTSNYIINKDCIKYVKLETI